MIHEIHLKLENMFKKWIKDYLGIQENNSLIISEKTNVSKK